MAYGRDVVNRVQYSVTECYIRDMSHARLAWLAAALLALASCSGGGGGGTDPITPPPPDPSRFTLDVERLGSGGGVVSSQPAGIACGETCSAPYASGVVVTLTAVPDEDSLFTSWSGCDEVTGTTCTATMTEDRLVRATFDEDMIDLPTPNTTRLAGRAPTCASVAVGQSCALTITVANDDLTRGGVAFEVEAPEFIVTDVEARNVPEGCHAGVGPSRVALVCPSEFDGADLEVDIALERTSGGDATIFLRESGLLPFDGGREALPDVRVVTSENAP